jgi:hypothetical protein
MSKYSEGPWHTTKLVDRTRGLLVKQQSGQVVCECEIFPEMEANAMLIATAPELLETLEEIEAYFRHYRPSNLRETLPSVYENLKAVIAKAKGVTL